MEYKNFEKAKSIVSKIDDRKRLLERILSCEEILFRYSSGAHILTVELNKSIPSPNYGLNTSANTFREESAAIIQDQITVLMEQLKEL